MVRDSSNRLFVLGCGLLLALEAYVLILMPVGRTRASGRHVVALELGEGGVIAQQFVAQADGLHAIRAQVRSTAAAESRVEWMLRSKNNDRWQDWHRGALVVRGREGTRWEMLEFPAIAASSGATYMLELRLAGSSGAIPAPPPALMASTDRPLRHSALVVDGRERWGDLLFDTRAYGDTVLGHVGLKVVPALPAVLQHIAYVWLALAMVNALLVGAAWTVWRLGADAAPATPAIAPVGARNVFRSVAVSVLLLSAIGVTAGIIRHERGRVDLIDELYAADMQSSSPLHAAFDVFEKEIGPERRRVLFAHATSRIAWRLSIPPRARFRTEIALDPDAWGRENDGVVFRVAIVEPSTTLGPGGTIPLFMRHVNAANIAADRRWIPVDIDLRGFAGKTIDLVLTTEPSLPGYPVDPSYDWALWAAPRIQ